MNILYDILIQPLVVIYDILFSILYGLIEEPVFSIVALSLLINILVLPLYRKADLLQKEEQEKVRKMKPWLDHIRKNFFGDERFMMQSAYYRIEHYNPLNVIKEAGPLILQIPFFIAAYRYISSIPLLEGASFGPIPNLLRPDGLIQASGVTINILPILMTLINCISGYIYTKGGTLRQKIQIYGTALLFLALLYKSPSGLVIYWIANQCFSLCKNIYFTHEIKNIRIYSTVAAVSMVFLIAAGMIMGKIGTGLDIFMSECILFYSFAVIIRMIIELYHTEMPGFVNRFSVFLESANERRLFPQVFLTGICFASLMGVFIPSSVLVSSVSEFINKETAAFRSELLWYPASVYFGFFVIWMTVIIMARDGKRRRNLAAGLWILLGIALVNQFLFDPNVGVLYSDLVFDGSLQFGILRIILNIFVCAGIAVFFLYVFIRHPNLMMRIAAVVAAALIILGIKNIMMIYRSLDDQNFVQSADGLSEKTLTFSRNGRNVIVFMLDRAIGGYAPYIFDEKPELMESYQGFVYYPNTISFGAYTNSGTPGLFGGYEYTPAEINKRDTEKLRDKHDEALKLMPVLFTQNDFRVTVCDPPYAGYKQVPDLSIYREYPEVNAYNLSGRFTARYNASLRSNIGERQKHNFIFYSLFRSVPLFMKGIMYNNGRYLVNDEMSYSYYSYEFIDQYAVLDALPSLTSVSDDDSGSFLMLQNSTTHEPVSLSPPDYLVDGEKVSKSFKYEDRTLDDRTMTFNNQGDWNHYCVNMAVYLEIADWLDYLKEEDVYDNTRIIIVSDHGRNLGQFKDMIHPDGLDVEFVWPLLMVKDFDGNQPFSTDLSFMTNADVPTLAFRDIIENPVNPFTGNAINDEMKRNGNLCVLISENWSIDKNNGTTFVDDNVQWWSVHDNIFDMKNWKRIDESEVGK